jgi:hypothetical protein
MFRRTAGYAAALTMLSLFSLFSLVAQSNESSNDVGDELVRWKTDCSPKGCMMETDVLRGESGDPPDSQDFREYIGIDVGLLRSTQKPGYISFLVDPRAQRDQGIFVTFSKTTMEHGKWKLNLDPQGASRLAITGCNKDACTARVPLGVVEEGKDTHKMDLLDKFLNSDHLLLLYLKDGKAYRTMVILSSFKKEYRRVMATEMAPPDGAKP